MSVQFVMAYSSVTYVSKILWRFFGGSSPDNPKVGLRDIQYIFNDDKTDKVILKPYYGSDGKSKKYIRQIMFQEESSIHSMTPLEGGKPEDEGATIYAEEDKAVCYCDIPINHLALHMKKYNTVGIGIDRDLLASKAPDLQPVRYYFIRNKKDFDNDVNGVFKVSENGENRIVSLEKYIKIPTLFKGNVSISTTFQPEVDGLDLSEGFNSIYEEREWKHFDSVEISVDQISFLLLPSRKFLKEIGKLKTLIESNVGIIYADELFPEGET